jgi:hypothetical protein
MIAGAIRAELARVLGQALEPIRTKVEETITTAAQRAAAPVQARIERLVNDTAHRAVDAALDALRSGRARR